MASTSAASAPEAALPWGSRTYVMGVINLTPDSFSDGGRFDRPADALHQARAMLRQGADLLDLGGQSTRPGAMEISAEQELERVLPALELMRSACAQPGGPASRSTPSDQGWPPLPWPPEPTGSTT